MTRPGAKGAEEDAGLRNRLNLCLIAFISPF